uniref:Glycosyltransferase family 1 protein n=1 Tax=candidate division WOR-3 bacterium TaxID=2052148 RepID=A0A7C4YIE2_UNCW3
MFLKPKILIINWQDIKNPLSGGAEVHLFEIFGRLKKYYEIHLLCDSFKNAEKEEELNGIFVHRTGNRNTFNFNVPSAFERLNKKYHFELVIEDLNKIPFYGSFYIPQKRIAILHHFFGDVIFQETNPLFGFYVYLNERLVPFFYKDVDFVCVSKGTREELLKHGMDEKRIKVIYNGVDFERFKPSKKLDIPVFSAVGRIKRYKRLDILIEAINIAKNKGAHFKVIIVGKGNDMERIKKMCIDKGLDEIVDFKGFVSEEEKIKILGESWAHINTSPKEGWGLTSIEAQSCGTLSVVPDSPGLNETIISGKTGFIYKFGDAEALGDILFKLSKNRELIEKMGREAREFSKRFNWDISANQFKEIIDEKISCFR